MTTKKSTVSQAVVDKFAVAMHKRGQELGSCTLSWEEETSEYRKRMSACIKAGLEAVLK